MQQLNENNQEWQSIRALLIASNNPNLIALATVQKPDSKGEQAIIQAINEALQIILDAKQEQKCVNKIGAASFIISGGLSGIIDGKSSVRDAFGISFALIAAIILVALIYSNVNLSKQFADFEQLRSRVSNYSDVNLSSDLGNFQQILNQAPSFSPSDPPAESSDVPMVSQGPPR